MEITGRFIYNNYGKKDASLKDDIQAIYTSSSQLYQFVDNFLEYAKETDIKNNESAPYALYILVSEKIEFFRNIASSRKTALYNNVPKDMLLTVNRHLLSIILHNLLDNAIKNTYDGKIIFSAPTIDGRTAITIKDTGKGMSKEKVQYYNSLQSNMARKVNQKGMGLHIITDLLAIIGGEMEIESAEGVGTEITLTKKSTFA